MDDVGFLQRTCTLAFSLGGKVTTTTSLGPVLFDRRYAINGFMIRRYWEGIGHSIDAFLFYFILFHLWSQPS